MLVDDMDIGLRQLKRLKLWEGETDFCIAAEAKNGQEALDILQKDRIDLIITDIKMPKIDGIELLKEVNEKSLCPCVVLLSDYEDFAYAKQGIQYGAFDYLGKPAGYEDIAGLLDKVDQFLKKKKYESERVRNLEVKLEEKLEDHFPSAEMDRLIGAFLKKHPETSAMTDRLAEAILVMSGRDPLKSGISFKRAAAELLQKVSEQYVWLDMFIDASILKGIDFSGFNNADEAAAEFVQSVKILFSSISGLEYGSDPEQLENKISRLVLMSVDHDITIEGIATSMYMNRKYLSEAFRQKTGALLIEYITRVKMKRAARLLGQGGRKTYEIALLLGFRDTEYFSRLFKKHMGVSPSEYRGNMGV
jgi:two-component system response regulator YesN